MCHKYSSSAQQFHDYLKLPAVYVQPNNWTTGNFFGQVLIVIFGYRSTSSEAHTLIHFGWYGITSTCFSMIGEC